MKSTFAENLKKIKTKNSLTTKKLAKLIGVHASTMYNWEKGKSKPNLKYLILLANQFNVKIDELIVFNSKAD